VINSLLPIIFEASLFALAAGLVYGIFGGGSGLFLMPGFYFLLRHFPVVSDQEMQVAIATTAATSAILGIMPTIMQFKKNNVQFHIVKKVSLGILCGTLLAVILLSVIPSAVLKRLFGIIVIVVAIWFWCYRQDKDKKVWHLKAFKNFMFTSLIGLLWFLLGVAVFTVPYLHKCGIDMRKAVGTGTLISTLFSAVAAILLIFSGSLQVGMNIHHLGYVNTTLFIIAVIPSIIGAIVGAKISIHLPQQHLKKIYACLIFVIGIIMLV
jgi:uncharacterized membrane protein YfcA